MFKYSRRLYPLNIFLGKYKQIFENRILRRKYGYTRDANREWRRLHNEELLILYRPPNKIIVNKSRSLRLVEHVARMGENKSLFKILTGKLTRKTSVERPTCRWSDNIELDFDEIST